MSVTCFGLQNSSDDIHKLEANQGNVGLSLESASHMTSPTQSWALRDVCGHCGKSCTAAGCLKEAVECGLCYTCVHDGVTEEDY